MAGLICYVYEICAYIFALDFFCLAYYLGFGLQLRCVHYFDRGKMSIDYSQARTDNRIYINRDPVGLSNDFIQVSSAAENRLSLFYSL